MTKRTDLHDVLDGLIVPSEKVASRPDLSTLSLFELEALMESKTAGNGDPLREHMHRKGLLKKKQAEDVEYTGQVNNGVPSMPEWPRAALGVDSAGRKASPEEKREQEKTVTPDVQHVEPHADGEQFVSKGAHDAKLLGLFEKQSVSPEWVKRMSSSGAADRALREVSGHLKNPALYGHNPEIVSHKKELGSAWKKLIEHEKERGAAESRILPFGKKKAVEKATRKADLRGAEMEGIREGVDRGSDTARMFHESFKKQAVSKEAALDSSTVRKMEEAASSKLLSGLRGAHAPAIPRDPKMFAPHAARGELSDAIKAMRKSSSLAAVGAALGRPF